MTVKYYEERIDLSLEEIEFNIHEYTKLIKFGPGDIFNTEHKKFTDQWMGEYSKHSNEFKLFKTELGTDNTSEFCVKGKLYSKPDHTYVRYSVNIHYKAFVALLGLNLFVLSVIVVTQKRGWFDSWLLIILTFIAMNVFYVFSKLRDFRETEDAFQKLISEKPWKEKDDQEIEEEFKKTMEVLNKYKRVCYLPKVAEQANSFNNKSKIGGFPYLRNENDWPLCPNCQRNMQLFLQLNLQELPERKENGLVQLFYCTNNDHSCESDLEAFFPFSKAVCCRKIEITGASFKTETKLDEIFPEKIIIGWTPMDDYPHHEEYLQLGIDLDISDEVYELMEKRKAGLTIERDKLFGWPFWVQSVEYPFDRKTKNQMQLFFQFDSENNLPYMFGDAGIGHLTQSPDNKEELAFGWACY